MILLDKLSKDSYFFVKVFIKIKIIMFSLFNLVKVIIKCLFGKGNFPGGLFQSDALASMDGSPKRHFLKHLFDSPIMDSFLLGVVSQIQGIERRMHPDNFYRNHSLIDER